MSLKEFLEAFKVHAPYYVRELHNGVGSKFLVSTDDYLKDSKRLNFDVIGLGVSVHRFLGALLEVDLNV